MTADNRHQMNNETMRPFLKRLARHIGLRRTHVAAARMYGERRLLAAVPRSRGRMRGRILAYHAVGTPEWGVNDISPARFRRHIEFALRSGYRFVPAEEIARTGGNPMDLAITFDDGVASVATNAAPILADYRIPWTMFIVSDWAAGTGWYHPEKLLRWNAIDRLAGAGATIGSHSASHANFASLAPDMAEREIVASRRAIEKHIGISPTSFAIPYGRARDWTSASQEIAAATGYAYVYSYCEHKRYRGTVPRTPITRFDSDRLFHAALRGAFDRWEEWI